MQERHSIAHSHSVSHTHVNVHTHQSSVACISSILVHYAFFTRQPVAHQGTPIFRHCLADRCITCFVRPGVSSNLISPTPDPARGSRRRPTTISVAYCRFKAPSRSSIALRSLLYSAGAALLLFWPQFSCRAATRIWTGTILLEKTNSSAGIEPVRPLHFFFGGKTTFRLHLGLPGAVRGPACFSLGPSSRTWIESALPYSTERILPRPRRPLPGSLLFCSALHYNQPTGSGTCWAPLARHCLCHWLRVFFFSLIRPLLPAQTSLGLVFLASIIGLFPFGLEGKCLLVSSSFLLWQQLLVFPPHLKFPGLTLTRAHSHTHTHTLLSMYQCHSLTHSHPRT